MNQGIYIKYYCMDLYAGNCQSKALESDTSALCNALKLYIAVDEGFGSFNSFNPCVSLYIQYIGR
jgi:hypothetical protein